MTAVYNYLASKMELLFEKKYYQKSLLTSVCIIEECFIIVKIRTWFMMRVTLPARNLATDKHRFSQNLSVFIRENPWLISSEKVLP